MNMSNKAINNRHYSGYPISRRHFKGYVAGPFVLVSLCNVLVFILSFPHNFREMLCEMSCAMPCEKMQNLKDGFYPESG